MLKLKGLELIHLKLLIIASLPSSSSPRVPGRLERGRWHVGSQALLMWEDDRFAHLSLSISTASLVPTDKLRDSGLAEAALFPSLGWLPSL